MIFTIEDLSDYLKISKETLYKMVQRDEVPAFKIGNQWRFQKERIDQWLFSISNTPKTSPNSNIMIGEDTDGIR